MTSESPTSFEPDLDAFRAAAREWLDAHAQPRATSGRSSWGEGSDSVALFQSLAEADERALVDAHRDWLRLKSDHGWAHLTWDPKWGGRGLPYMFERAFAEQEHNYVVPPSHESISITTEIIAPTVHAHGTDEQRLRFLRRMLRADDVWCQLFSEPAAGSDLAGLTTRAEPAPGGWLINGQKAWTSGAQFADWGYLLARTDPSVPKHRGLTAFLVPMHDAGVTVRPLRQATGGSSFNEVFFTDLEIADTLRLGDVGGGWRVAMTTLGFERTSSEGDKTGATVARLFQLAEQMGRATDPRVRQGLAQAYTCERLLELTNRRIQSAVSAGTAPGPEGSIGRLLWTQTLGMINEVAADLLGPYLVADTGEWGTFAWTEHLLGTLGYRIAGGTEEIQRNIIGERVLGLPAEPRPDRDLPFRVPAG